MSRPGFAGSPPTASVGPVRGRVVTAEWAPRVVTPLHDVLTEEERRTVLAGNPDSYLHVTGDPLALRRLLDRGAYRCLVEPGWFVYRMREAGGEHTGVVASVGLPAFADGSVLGHERVQPLRVEALVRHYEQVPLRSELVTLFHRSDAALRELVGRVTSGPPLLELTDVAGVEQTVWQVGLGDAAALGARLETQRLYIADGHHRVAAALRCWDAAGRPDASAVLCVLYPQDQIVLHAFHRRLRGPVVAGELVEALTPTFDVRRAAGPELAGGTIGLYVDRQWHVLEPRERSGATAVDGLDVTTLHTRLLGALLGIHEDDPRLEFVPDAGDLQAVVRACDDDRGALFTLRPPALDDVIEVAERQEVMPAKTTYLRPKPRAGIFLQ